jgi:hypothetical protein
MGNTVASRPRNKVNLLVEETQDFSFNLTQNISQTAEQTIVSAQSQNITFDIKKLEGCRIDITQSANIMAKQDAIFKAVFTNPRELIRKICVGPDSILEQAFASQSKVMKNFLECAKRQTGANTDQNLKLKMTNILKLNIDQTSIQKCSQNIFTSQDQRATILGNICKDSTIRIAQDLIINAAQDCFFEVTQNALMEDPAMRRAVREFNGDYQDGYLDDQIDAGAKIPDACFNTGKITYRNVNTPGTPVASFSGFAATESNSLEDLGETEEQKSDESDKKEIQRLKTMNKVLFFIIIFLIISMFFIFSSFKK